MSNYPPGVSDRPYNQGVYKFSCADHGTSYGHGYMELGGLFFEDDTVMLCAEAEWGEWVMVDAAHCETHGRWSERKVFQHMFVMTTDSVWICADGHLFVTSEL